MVYEIRMNYRAWRRADMVGIGEPEQWCYYTEAGTADEAKAKIMAERSCRHQAFPYAQIESVLPIGAPVDRTDPRFIP